MYVAHLTCWECGTQYSPGKLRNLCDCGKPLRVDYDLARVAGVVSPNALKTREHTLWRYRELLPLPLDVEPLTLGKAGLR